MRIRLGIVMESIHAIHLQKDRLPGLSGAPRRALGAVLHEPQGSFYIATVSHGQHARAQGARPIPARFDLEEATNTHPLADLDVILMRRIRLR